ncbi:thioredoxin family protein [Malacoplasma iowae]|uniref:Thioredoxin family protein n=1 Tax=Malacoplasma iowae 695 TaxID=1048830 RepID=A0A6P1LG17_MALIO|nr:thioredoxin family protein [Malacoplasma iowae]VEU63169.1 Uncharacterised protein [Mycoplasmopsis fermentans]EGZ31271.1 thioredoxin [Malacoplasma iowae 695]QHG89560.1 thioredoxin family protein [Malacoplasma iowae 695]WPL35661.1 thioredoxin family protein [Malacoplasma iowae]WPL38957.1 thioredoxin family protein [Malacoplasma iowae]
MKTIINVKSLNIKSFSSFLNKNKNKIIAIFYADWCPYCLRNVPQIISWISELKINNVIYIKIDDVNQDVWIDSFNKNEWNLKVVPTVRIYDKNKLIKEHSNEITKKEFENFIKE